jgi:hypothetical protein
MTREMRLGTVASSPNHGFLVHENTLFADIKFPTVESLQSWKETFPDPSTSPARYANTLAIDYPQVVTAVDEASGWIRAFSRVEHLEVGTRIVYLNFYQSAAPLVTFHGFSPLH